MNEPTKLYRQVTSYQHVEKIGNSEVQGILQGKVWIQEKLDGANLSVAWDQESDDFIICSRNNVVYHTGECHNKGFQKAIDYIKSEFGFKQLFAECPDLILRCEYLTKHKVPVKKEFNGKVVIYDVEITPNDLRNDTDYDIYLTYDEAFKASGDEVDEMSYTWYRQTFPELLWLTAITAINPTVEELQEWSKGHSDYFEYREGIVIKNYDFTNKYGRTKWGKVISPVFDAKKSLKARSKLEVGELEQMFVDKFITPGYVEKEIHKIRDAKGDVSTKDMGQIIGRVPYELFQDEMWRFLGKANAGEFNFRVWRAATIDKVRKYALAYFNSTLV